MKLPQPVGIRKGAFEAAFSSLVESEWEHSYQESVFPIVLL
jgi:hypothetical protein